LRAVFFLRFAVFFNVFFYFSPVVSALFQAEVKLGRCFRRISVASKLFLPFFLTFELLFDVLRWSLTRVPSVLCIPMYVSRVCKSYFLLFCTLVCTRSAYCFGRLPCFQRFFPTVSARIYAAFRAEPKSQHSFHRI
jgi:hypothetical protein